MRPVLSKVPQQLQSATLRYQHPLVNLNCVRGLRTWQDRLQDGIRPPAIRTSGGCVRDERLRRLEAILVLAREPLSSRRLCQYANLADATEARTLVRHLNDLLDGSGRAFRVEEVAGGFQLLTRPKFATWLRRLATIPKELRLSAPALETLSVIAYRQPAGRAEIEAIRGVNCGEIVRQLMDRDLVRIAGRSDDLGRPYLYATTRRFLQLFGLRRLEDLPRAEQLRKTDLTQNSANDPTDTTEHRNQEESDVTATIRAELSPEELRQRRLGGVPVVLPRASDEEDLDEAADEEEEDDEDEFDELEEDDDDDFDDEEDDDDDEFDDVDDDEGFEDEDWEEVDDDDEELDDDDEDDDWDDDDDEEEEDEEEESWE